MAFFSPDKASVQQVIKESSKLPTDKFLEKAAAVTRNPDFIPPDPSKYTPETYNKIISEKSKLAWSKLFKILHEQDLVDWKNISFKKKEETGLAVRDKGDIEKHEKNRFKSEFSDIISPTESTQIRNQDADDLERGGKPVKDKNGQTKSDHKYNENAKEPEITDYYEVLGASPTDSFSKIRSLRNKLISQESADSVEGRLRNNGLSTEEIYLHPEYVAATVRQQRINEAYSILGDENIRPIYDREHKDNFPNRWESAANTSSSDLNTTSVTIAANPTSKPIPAKGKTDDFIKSLKNNNLSLSAQDIEELRTRIGVDLGNADIQLGRALLGLGLDPNKVVEISTNQNIPTPAKATLQKAAIVEQSLIDAKNNKLPEFKVIQKESGNPTPLLTAGPVDNSVTISTTGNKVNTIIQNFGGDFKNILGSKVADTAEAKTLNSVTSSAVKKFGSKAIEKLGLKGLATAVSGFFGKITPWLAAAIPGIGPFIAGAIRLLSPFLIKIVNGLKKFIDKNKELFALGGILGGLMGAPVVAAASAGILFFAGGFPLVIGGVVGVAGAAWTFVTFIAGASGITASFLAWFLGISLFVVLTVIIINLGAYVAPLGNLEGYTPGDCLGDPPPKPEASGVKFSEDENYAYPVASFASAGKACYHWGSHISADLFSTTSRVPLVAYEDGVIVNVVTNDPKGGKYVILKGTTSGRFYYYAHNCHNFVQIGDRVSAGDVIATMDETGNGRVQHVHFAIDHDDQFIDGWGDVCPFTDFEDKFKFGCCTNTAMNCIEGAVANVADLCR